MSLDANKRAELLADLIRDVPLNGDPSAASGQALEGQIRHVLHQLERQVRAECAMLVAGAGHANLARMIIAAGPGGREMERWGSRAAAAPDVVGGRGRTRGQVTGRRPRLALQLLAENGPMTTDDIDREMDYASGREGTYGMLYSLAQAGHVQRVTPDVWRVD